MIIKAKKYHKKQIADLWCEAFGDGEKEVSEWLDFLLDYFVVYEEDERACGMLSVLPVSMGEKIGGYVYAVATKRECRGRGICTKLLDYAKKCGKYEFLVLVPQSEGLFDFYKKSGFVSFSATASCIFSAEYAKNCGLKCKAVSASEYAERRRKFFEGKKLIEWREEVLEFAKTMYGAEFYALSRGGTDVGVAFCFKDGEELNVKELCADETHQVCVEMARFLGVKRVRAEYTDFTSKPSAMIFPRAEKDIYFGINLG